MSGRYPPGRDTCTRGVFPRHSRPRQAGRSSLVEARWVSSGHNDAGEAESATLSSKSAQGNAGNACGLVCSGFVPLVDLPTVYKLAVTAADDEFASG